MATCSGCGNGPLWSKNTSGLCRSCNNASRTGEANWRWQGNGAGEFQRHRRIWRIKGKAKDHACVDCGKPAAEWSQTHGSDPYNIDSYRPRCNSCHIDYDRIENGGTRKRTAKCEPGCECGKHTRSGWFRKQRKAS